MKRYVKASWNGIVPVSKIVNNSDLTREAAKVLKKWIYQQGLDVGYSYLEDFLDSIDLDAEYARMLKYKKENPERWKQLMGDM